MADVKTMELKKTQQTEAPTPEVAISGRKAQDFIGDVKGELKKINWTSREELMVYTKIVVGATLFFGVSLYFIDLIIQGVLNGLAAVVRFITG